jgi:hypothetical protein
MTLPASVRGKTIGFWQNKRLFFSSFAATPGGKVDLTHGRRSSVAAPRATWPRCACRAIERRAQAVPLTRWRKLHALRRSRAALLLRRPLRLA